MRGGPPIERDADRTARLRLAEELGHSREAISSAYLGKSLVMRSKRGNVSATTTSAEKLEGAKLNIKVS